MNGLQTNINYFSGKRFFIITKFNTNNGQVAEGVVNA